MTGQSRGVNPDGIGSCNRSVRKRKGNTATVPADGSSQTAVDETAIHPGVEDPTHGAST